MRALAHPVGSAILAGSLGGTANATDVRAPSASARRRQLSPAGAREMGDRPHGASPPTAARPGRSSPTRGSVRQRREGHAELRRAAAAAGDGRREPRWTDRPRVLRARARAARGAAARAPVEPIVVTPDVARRAQPPARRRPEGVRAAAKSDRPRGGALASTSTVQSDPEA